MPDKNENLNKGETEPKTESSSWEDIENLSEKIKEISEQSKLVGASGEKLNDEAENNENLTEKDKENIEKATEEATNEAKKAKNEAREKIAEATGEAVVGEPTENKEKEPGNSGKKESKKEKKEKPEGDIYKGFEREQEVVARNKGVLKSGWKIVDLKEGKIIGDEKNEEKESTKKVVGIAVIQKEGEEPRDISIDTLDKLNNRDWGEIGKQAGKGVGSMTLSWAGVKVGLDATRYLSEKSKISKLGETIEGLSKFTAKSADRPEREKRSKKSSEKLRTNFENLNNILEKTKEGTEKKSAGRKKIAQILQLTRKGEMNEEQRKKEVEKINEIYLSQKTSGMQVAREAVNSALIWTSRLTLPVATPAVRMAIRAGMMPVWETAEKYSQIKKSKQREVEKESLEKSVFKTEAKDITKTVEEIKEEGKGNFKETFVALAKETYQKSLFKGENKTKLQKTLAAGQVYGKLARFTGYIFQAKYGITIPNLLHHFSEQPNLGSGGSKISPEHLEALGKKSDYRDITDKLWHKVPFVPEKAPLETSTPQEQLVEKFPGLRNQTGGTFATADNEKIFADAGHWQQAREKSIVVNYINKDNHPDSVKIPFTDKNKTATETLNDYIQKNNINPDKITRTQIGDHIIGNKFIPGINQETETNANAGRGFSEKNDFDHDQEIQNKVGNTVQKFIVLENRDLVHAGNEIHITHKDGRTFNLPIEEKSNNWDTLEQFYHDNLNVKPKDITSIDVVKGSSHFEPGDLPHHITTHETGQVTHSDKIVYSDNDATDFEAKKLSYIPTPDEQTPQSAEKSLKNQNEKINPGGVQPDISENLYPKDSKFPNTLDNNLKSGPQEPTNTDFMETNKEATKIYNEVSSSLYRGNREVEGRIIDHLDEIDALKQGSVFNGNDKAIAEHAEEIKKIAYNDLLPKKYKDQTLTGILAGFKKNADIEKSLDAWVNDPKNKTDFDKIHDIAQKINSSNSQGNEGITHLNKFLDVLRSNEK